MDDNRRARDHRDGLGHPGLTLDVGLLRVRSGALVECLVRIIAAPDDWETARVLLRVGGSTVVR
jgi:hypothetical protein